MFALFSRKEKNIAPDGSKFSPSKITTKSEIEKIESEFGFSLPLSLKELYVKTGNGGFGPGYGVIGISGGFTDYQGFDILGLYKNFIEPDPEDLTWNWPKGLVPICNWGCGVYSCVHCLEEGMPVYSVDTCNKEVGEPMESILKIDKGTFNAWVASWKK